MFKGFLSNLQKLQALPKTLLFTMATSSSPPQYTIIKYDETRHTKFPYSERDLSVEDPSPDENFYSVPRFVTHIDDNAIAKLREYYGHVLPKKGAILDLCSSWVSHLPRELEEIATKTARSSITESQDTLSDRLEVTGIGMNNDELNANPVLRHRILQNLNKDPDLPSNIGPFDAVACVASIDYLTSPQQVLASIHKRMKEGASIHLVVTNRCFPSKAVRRWLMVSEDERLGMVGDYLWFSGFKEVEIMALVDPLSDRFSDPLWVVRGRKVA